MSWFPAEKARLCTLGLKICFCTVWKLLVEQLLRRHLLIKVKQVLAAIYKDRFRTGFPPWIFCPLTILTAHLKTWPATRRVDQPEVFIPSNIARLSGMFRLNIFLQSAGNRHVYES
ncbi:hypothetical protein TNCV_4864881 [Trichonephila clavipes]|nr:hypothetical protein TNCV_4864881 [Trichonephila clavipes]